MQIPKGAEAYINGSYYKFGAEKKAFIFINGEWRLSTLTASEVERRMYKMYKSGEKPLAMGKENATKIAPG
ncbi:hypothetical protein [Candidatus Sororendozoicomonas aggregata]|uniref:hypothetical protein n=1 Tax=Candidatus Sororendozoicomonas aggregata TaxID=3073239 RepID=UPI002ED5C615